MSKFTAVVAMGCSMVLGTGMALAQASSADMDKTFIMKASQSDFTEIKFSQLAAEKATNPRVKAYANKMIADHNKLEADMKPFANKLGVTPMMELDADHQQKYDSLSSMSGMGFDKMYMTAMAADHHVALDLFKSEVASTTDKPMKATVAKGEKVVAQHTMMADKAVSMMGGATSGM